MKKKLYLLMIMFSAVLTLQAEDYKILALNTPNIVIGNQTLAKGDTFSDASIIKWSKDTQALKAMNLKTKKIKLFVAKEFAQNNSRTIQDYYIKQNHLSSRGSFGVTSLIDLQDCLNSNFYLLDTLEIDIPFELKENEHFQIHYECKYGLIEKNLETKGEILFLKKEDFPFENESLPFDLKISVSFINDQDSDQCETLTDSMIITFL